MYIKRELEQALKTNLSKPEILAIVGPRQSGKTTLLKEIFKPLKDAVYVDFEDRDVLDLFNNDIKAFYRLHGQSVKYLFIDEFQYAREGGKKLKYLYDTFKIKIIISGSSVLDLTHQAVKFLVGRIFIFHLYPLDFKEYLSYRAPSLCGRIYLDVRKKADEYLFSKRKFPPVVSSEVIKEVNKYYGEYVIFGGYPRVALAKNKDEKLTVLKNIYNTYFLREIRDILQLSTEEELQKLIKALSLHIGSLVMYNELCQITSLNYHNLIKHLNILEKTFVIKRLLPFCKNKRTELSKSPKIYFMDNGFRNIAAGNFHALDERTDRGSLNENFVAGQLLKQGHILHYWRTKSQAEVDFVLEEGGKKIAVEVKSTVYANKTGRSLFSFIEKYAPHRVMIVSENYSSFDRKRGVFFLPVCFV